MKESMVPESVFGDKDYYHYMVQYQGDIQEEVSKI